MTLEGDKLMCDADGCEGDLGYGAHSVPGGRVKNPEAYAKFSQQQQQLYEQRQQRMRTIKMIQWRIR